MDGSRFDALTRAVGSARSRRALLPALGGLLLAPLGLMPAAARKKKKKVTLCRNGKTVKVRKKKAKRLRRRGATRGRCRAGCQAIGSGEQAYGISASATAKFKKKQLRATQTVQPVGPDGEIASHIEVTRGGSSLLTIVTEESGGTTTVSVTYGNAFGGARARFVNDGSTITGEVDGRAIVPMPAGADPSQARFADGAPAPDIQVNPKFAAAVESLMQKAARNAENCDPAPQSGARASRRATGRSHETNLACLGKKAACSAAAAACGWSAAGACAPLLATLFGYGICLAAAGAVCVGSFQVCMNAARGSEDCCPVPCGEFTCCHSKAHSCLRAGRCCDPGTTPCHGQNCCRQGETCSPDGVCCPTPQTSCGGVCCLGSCINGSCCTGRVCGGQCCSGGLSSICCGGRCCNGTCNTSSGVCCSTGSLPCGVACCSSTCCGSVCCDSDQICSGGICTTVCPPGVTACPRPGGGVNCCNPPAIYCCSSGNCSSSSGCVN